MSGREDQQDLFQEIVLQVWKSYPSFRSESQFSTWMYRVAVNTAITFFHQQKKKVVTTAIDEENEDQPTPHHDNADQKMEIFYAAVHQLNPIEKALIFLYLEDMSHRDIGQQLGISEGNARVKLSRTKEKLQQLIQQHQHGTR